MKTIYNYERLGKLGQGISQDSFDMDQTQSIPGLATSNMSSEPGLGSGSRRESHVMPLRKPTIVQESSRRWRVSRTSFSRCIWDVGWTLKSQRMASRAKVLRRPGEVKVELRRPGEVKMAVGVSSASEDEDSSTTSYSANDGNANKLISIARGRGLKILKGVKKPGGLMDKENKE